MESGKVQKHYGKSGILDRITGFLRERKVDPDRPDYRDLHPVDQLHGRGAEATREHIEHAGIKAGMHVLDLGCGIGGSSRYLAASGCRVTGIDLTQEFIDIAGELTRRCGLDANIKYRQADALRLPFESGTFDHVWCHNVTMNIADKQGLAAEVARVLRKGGRFSCVEQTKGPGAELIFPVPWANDASSSFLVTPDEMRKALEAGGLRVVKEIDLTPASLNFMQVARARAERGEPPLQMNHIVMGEDMAERQRNSGRNMVEKRSMDHFILADRS